jgi:hypothetical protein
MAYLDVSPMITALNSSPDQFAFSTGALHHIPSGHRFEFDRLGIVHIQAQCACAHLEVSRDQEKALFEAYNGWQANYWRPLEINRQFARHFELPWWQRLLVAITGRLHRATLKLGQHEHEWKAAQVPAE